jgi:putative solute:sodium symporter small subunit
MSSESDRGQAYWKKNLKLLLMLLSVWFFVAYVLSIFLVEPLNRFHIGGFPLGFWFAQQGSILVFIVLILVYARAMAKLDRELGEQEGGQS